MDFLPSVELLRNHLVAHDMAIRQIMDLDTYIARLSGDTFVSAMDDHMSSGFQNMIRISVAEGLKRMYKDFRLNKWLQVQEMAATVRRVLESGGSPDMSPPQPQPQEPPRLLAVIGAEGAETWISPELQRQREQRIEAEEVLAEMSNLSSIEADSDASLNGFEPDVSTDDPYDETSAGYYGMNVPGASSDDALEQADLSAIRPHNSNVDPRLIVSHSEQILGAELYENSVLNTAVIDINISQIDATEEQHRMSANVNISGCTMDSTTEPVQHQTHTAPETVNNGQLLPNPATHNHRSEPVLNTNNIQPVQDNTPVNIEANRQHNDNIANMSIESSMDWDDDSSYDELTDSLPGMLYAAEMLRPEDQAIRLDVEMGDMGIGHVLFDRVSRTWAVSHCEFHRDD